MSVAPSREFTSRPRASERTTRTRLSWWDRVKFLLLLGLLFAFFVGAEVADNPLLPYREAVRMTRESYWWILALMGLEVVRQIHFFVCERSSAYYLFWRDRVFAASNKKIGRFNAYDRYRVARAAKWLLFLVVTWLIVARLFDSSFFRAPFELISWLIDQTPAFLQVVIFLTFWIGFQFGLIIWFATRGGVETFFPDDIETRFEDVWGQDHVLDRVKENLFLLEHPDTIEDHGGYVPAGLLLWGPPGTGKTLMAEAMAGETGKPFVNIDASMLNTMGMGVIKVKLLFRKLRKYALKYDGVVAFFDEADAIGSRGVLAGQEAGAAGTASFSLADHTCGGAHYLSDEGRSSLVHGLEGPGPEAPPDRRTPFFMGMGGMGGGGGGVLQVLLTEMSGLKKPRGLVNRYARRVLGMKPKPPPKYRIMIVMATNMPQALDPAMLRPGRMGDRIYKVGYPSKNGRVRTYQGYLDKVPNSVTPEQVEKLATMTPYATGASMKGMVNEALISATQDGRNVVEWEDIIKAKHMKDLGPPEDHEYIERERHAVAIHEACHAIATYRLRKNLVIDLATIERRGMTGGFVSWIDPEDLFTNWRSHFEADVMVSLASLVGERMFFDGDSSNGVTGDLASATRLCILMESRWGMGSTIAAHEVSRDFGISGGQRPRGKQPKERDDDEKLAGSLGVRIEGRLQDLYRQTEWLLQENRVQILAVTHALEAHRTITGEDVEAVIERKPGPFVDGRVYADPRFAEMAEEYHAEVLAAHKERRPIALPLPVLPAVDEDLAALPVVAGANGDGPGPSGSDDDPEPDDEPDGGSSYPRRLM